MRGRVVGVVAAAVLTLALAGCGGEAEGGGDVASVNGAGTASTSASAAPNADAKHEMALKFAQCMRENGVQVDDPQPGQGVRIMARNLPQGTMEKAQEACKEFAEGAGIGQNANPQQAENMRKFAQCMRDNGVEAFPDPEGAGIRITPEVGEDPDFEAAQQKCAEQYLPQAGQGGS
ncbi:hypothetical protein HNP84_010162 [Thermocatellispora tengchongensis]|uniref:Secreted protein n=1 Tax=Thermocatellispora tengchongensis TaxID=1073253 RepID=A0A840PX09_9ACTN|nr:hypothetical protein [Thermocatellispora tengchongensis]MBB5140395.1 hypothetical protein [Thermocatellispora tengchongensis]